MLARSVRAAVAALVVLSFVALLASPALAQDAPPDGGAGDGGEPTGPVEADAAARAKLIADLGEIVRYLGELDADIKAKRTKLEAAESDDEKAQLQEELDRLRAQRASLDRDFSRIASGVVLAGSDEASQKLDWQAEVTELITPLVRELKSMTERPRKIERLKRELEASEQLVPALERGIANVAAALAAEPAPELRGPLEALEHDLTTRRDRVQQAMTVAKLQLEELTKDDQSFVDSAREVLRMFFRSRGRNLLLALAAFSVVFVVLRLLHRLIYRYSPIHNVEARPFYIRLIDVAYHLITALGATAALMAVFYVSGDWLLLSLVIIFFAGLAWGARHGLPLFWEQIKMVLNLGAVREGERIIYAGVPWRVARLNFYTRLENPVLESHIDLPVKHLFEMVSRACVKDEPWFPTRPDDWVLLGDGNVGQVVSQTHEVVRLRLVGGHVKTYPTADFLGLAPVDLSRGFGVFSTFGIDYEHQAVCTTEVPEKLKAHIAAGLAHHGDALLQLKVEFKTAGASSLDYLIQANFAGKAAVSYGSISREIQRLAVDACNDNGWGIPFQQVTIHRAEPVGAA